MTALPNPANQKPVDKETTKELLALLETAKKRKAEFIIKIFDEQTGTFSHEAVVDPNGLVRELRKKIKEFEIALFCEPMRVKNIIKDLKNLLAMDDEGLK